jgi:hypothetical protein
MAQNNPTKEIGIYEIVHIVQFRPYQHVFSQINGIKNNKHSMTPEPKLYTAGIMPSTYWQQLVEPAS